MDGVFSMDGDIINLPVVSRLCRKYGAWLMVDEAHSVGVLGRTGHGLEEFFDLPPNCIDIKMGTLSKAIPSVGGYVAGTSELCQYLLHESRAFIYSHSLSPPATASALAAFDLIEEEPEHVMRLQENIAHLDVQSQCTLWVTSAFLWAKRDLPTFAAETAAPWRVGRAGRRRIESSTD